MLDFDSNGIAVDAYGSRTYKRYAEILVDGKRAVGGVYIGQSTADELFVELHAIQSVVSEGGINSETWTPTGQHITVRLPDIINIFEPRREVFESVAYAEYDRPFDDVDALARFILDPENRAPLFVALRQEISHMAQQPPESEKGYTWTPTTVGIIRGMHQAQPLFDGKRSSYDQICVACKILDRAAFILRGAA